MEKLTPAMQQYVEIKRKYHDCLVLFRMGDFYETFFEDAEKASQLLGITLTKRGTKQEIPLAGVPYHALDNYLAKLMRHGIKVAICEQLEDPKLAKGVVKRDVIRVVTPGTLIETSMLKDKHNNYIVSIVGNSIAICDISTGEFFSTSVDSDSVIKDQVINELSKWSPGEVLIESDNPIKEKLKNYVINYPEDRWLYYENSYNSLLNHFSLISLDSFGLEGKEDTVLACGVLLQYIKETQKTALSHIKKISFYNQSQYLMLDQTTLKNLEITGNLRDNTEDNTLLSVIDHTKTAMGGRLLRKWITRPLRNIRKINARQDAVEIIKNDAILRQEIRALLGEIRDIERLIGKINYGNSNARDLKALESSLEKFPQINELLNNAASNYGTAGDKHYNGKNSTDKNEIASDKDFDKYYNDKNFNSKNSDDKNSTDKNYYLLKKTSSLPFLENLRNKIKITIVDDPPHLVREGGMIKSGVDKELDELHNIYYHSRDYLQEIEQKEKNKTGIKSLKVSFNKIFGYYIEITKANLALVPSDYIRKQTMVSAERYITEELKTYEEKILGAEEKIKEKEHQLFLELVNETKSYTSEIQNASYLISVLDVIQSFAHCAVLYNYSKPILYNENKLVIKEGRHPIVERLSDHFIPNDVVFDDETNMMIITGPNMAGKSTVMRQTALIIILAQIGSFVPATEAHIGLFDQIFTRIGAHDDLTHGQSTFMVEMHETAYILNYATRNSFVIMDEIGRGTSTYDGVSIAWGVAEYLHKTNAKIMFATHYHVLTELGNEKGIKNYNIAVKEYNGRIVFLHKLVEGGTDRSYGIHVAELAGLPKKVIERARELLYKFSEKDVMHRRAKEEIKLKQDKYLLNKSRKQEQLTLFDV